MSDWFPERQLSESEVFFIGSLCGGLPVKDPSRLDEFLRTSSEPFVTYESLRWVLHGFGKGVSEAMDVDPRAGSRVFRNAALFYAGVTANITPLAEVPRDEKLMEELMVMDAHVLTWSLYERIHDEAPSFCDLLEKNVGEALGTAADVKLSRLADIGAGLMHVVVARGLHNWAEAARMDEEFAELADMDDIFAAIEHEGQTE